MAVLRACLETGSEAVDKLRTSFFPLPFLPRLPSNLLPHLCSTLFHTQMDPVLPNVGAAELLFLFSPFVRSSFAANTLSTPIIGDPSASEHSESPSLLVSLSFS